MPQSRTRRLFLHPSVICGLAAASACGPVVVLEDGGDTEAVGTGSGAASPDDGGPAMPTTVSPDADAGTGPFDSGTGVESATAGPQTSSETGDDGTPLPPLPPLPRQCPADVLAGDVLLPQEVYIAGTLSEGACYRDALAHWSSPDDAVAGFDCYFDGGRAQIVHTGRVLYTNTFEGVLREFTCDQCPVDAETPYPADPLANDAVVATPACSLDEEVREFLVGPNGELAYRCELGGPWFGPEGELYLRGSNETLLHLGYDDLALTSTGVIDLWTGQGAPLDPPLADDIIAIRADPEGGFRVVVSIEAPQLWHVAVDGTTTMLGAFPDVPDGYSAGFNAALDGCGALYQLGGGPEVFQDVIVRRTVEGASDVVYDEASDPVVKLHISYLFTGA